jgi:hypothetical protein
LTMFSKYLRINYIELLKSGRLFITLRNNQAVVSLIRRKNNDWSISYSGLPYASTP